jgi:type VI secretion system protein ImpC
MCFGFENSCPFDLTPELPRHRLIPMQFSSEKAEYHLGTQTLHARRQAGERTPFCIAVLGDFSGRANQGVCETGQALATRARHAIDVDTLDHLPSRLNTRLQIPVGTGDGPRIVIPFADLESFHPDALCGRLEIFQRLLTTRQQLKDPTTFPKAAAQVRTWLSRPKASESPAGDDGGAESEESNTEAIERLLGKAPKANAITSPATDIETLIAEAVRPHIIPSPDPQQAELITQVEQAISARMQAILHHPDFQDIEACWRMLEFLISRVETDETLQVYAIDISKQELAADLASAESMQSTGLYRLIVEQTIGVSGADPYALLVGAYGFDQVAEDIKLLQHLGRVSQAAGSPFIAAGHSHYAGCASLAVSSDSDEWNWQPDQDASDLWQALRRSPEASYLGLVLPRYLQRLPYGEKTDPIDTFHFEEFSPFAGQKQYLWGHPAVLCASLLAEAFSESGWSLTSDLASRISDMPLHIYEAGGETHIIGCTEAPLTERAMQLLIDKGLMPILAIKGQDDILLPRFQSIAEPPTPLAGPWR